MSRIHMSRTRRSAPSRTRLQALIAAYGADPARWPAGEGATLTAALQADPALRAEWADAQALDAALASLPAPALPESLAARILQQAPAAAQAASALSSTPAPAAAKPLPSATNRPRPRFGWRDLWIELGGLRLAGPAFACALSLGFGLSWLIPTRSLDASAESDLHTYLALAWLDEGFDEELP